MVGGSARARQIRSSDTFEGASPDYVFAGAWLGVVNAVGKAEAFRGVGGARHVASARADPRGDGRARSGKNPRWVLAEAHLWSSSSCDAKVTCSGSMSISSIERVALPVTATAETAAPPRAPAAPKPRRPTVAKATVDGPAAASAPAATRTRAGAPPAPREADPLALEARATGPPLQPGASPARAASAPARAHAIMLGASVVLDRSGRETERGREVPTLVGVSRVRAHGPTQPHGADSAKVAPAVDVAARKRSVRGRKREPWIDQLFIWIGFFPGDRASQNENIAPPSRKL